MRIFFFLTLLIYSSFLRGQTNDVFIRNNAIEVVLNDSSKNDKFLKTLNEFRLIMVGEMHGTNEPAEFASFILRQLLNQGHSVQLGVEIPEEKMKSFIENPSEESLKGAEFFNSGYPDGRASDAWLRLIGNYYSNPNIKLFYFDVGEKEKKLNRDSVMYLNVKKRIVDDPKAFTVLISGNVHNRLIPFRSIKTMGYYLLNDKSLNLADRICAIDYQYNNGTMNNSRGSGLQLHVVDPTPTLFSEATPLNTYFCIMPKDKERSHNAVFFSRKVTAAKILNASK